MQYLIYYDDGIIECADIDDMTEYANSLLNSGYKDIRLVIKEQE